jgi:hypothetical protein
MLPAWRFPQIRIRKSPSCQKPGRACLKAAAQRFVTRPNTIPLKTAWPEGITNISIDLKFNKNNYQTKIMIEITKQAAQLVTPPSTDAKTFIHEVGAAPLASSGFAASSMRLQITVLRCTVQNIMISQIGEQPHLQAESQKRRHCAAATCTAVGNAHSNMQARCKGDSQRLWIG